MSFARPDLLGLALLLPALLLAALLLHSRRRRRVAALLADARLLRRIGGAELVRFPLLRVLLVTAAGAALGLAAASPQWGRRPVSTEARALDVVLALDVSKSMLATDVTPTRLERQRLLVRRLLREMPGDRFGLVVFAGRAYVLSPVTIDHGAIELYLDALEPTIVSQGGSSLESAVLMAAQLARGSEEVAGERAVVLVSDGEALEDVEGIRAAAGEAAGAGVRFYTVGMGTRAGAPVPEIDAAGMARGFKRDERGEPVISRLGDDLLAGIAERTGGAYFDGTDPAAISRLVARLGGMERTGGGSPERRTVPRERFELFIALALLLLALDAWLAHRRAPVRASYRAPVGAALVLALLTQGFGIGDVERGNRHYRAGRYGEAVAAYQEALAAGDASPRLRYNLGTALLQLGRYGEAETHLRAALAGVDPELRERAHYNLGNRFLAEGRQASGAEAERLLGAAVEAYQQALRITPTDAAAKWNLELALRERDERRQQPQPSQSESQSDEEQDQQAAGGGASPEPQPGESGPDPGQADDMQPLDQQQADQILNSADQDERRLARERLRRGQRRTPVLRDW